MMVRALAVAVERTGTGREKFLAAAQIAPLQLRDMDAQVSTADYRRAVRAAYTLADDPALGLHMGAAISLSSFDVIGRLFEHSRCLRDALQLLVRYYRVISDEVRIELIEGADVARIQFYVHDEDSQASQMAAELFNVWLLRVLRIFVGDAALPERVLFAYPRPKHDAEYARLFAGREIFDQAVTGIEIPCTWLDQPSPDHASELLRYLLSRAELLLAKSDREISATDRVKRWINSQTELVQPSLEQAAQALGTSPRSLKRRLREEGTQFSVLIDAARAAMAKRMLSDRERGIQDTAYAVGFRTPSAFSRAFKRWTGMGPKAYRKARERAPSEADASSS